MGKKAKKPSRADWAKYMKDNPDYKSNNRETIKPEVKPKASKPKAKAKPKEMSARAKRMQAARVTRSQAARKGDTGKTNVSKGPSRSQSTRQTGPKGVTKAKSKAQDTPDKINSKAGKGWKFKGGGARSGIASAAVAGIAEKYGRPIAKKAGKWLGKKLVPLGRKIDDAIPGINSADERKRKKGKK